VKDKPLLDRVCIVTGATSGIGKATALALAGLGASLVVVGRDAEKCATTVDYVQLETGSEHVEFIVADLSSQQEIRRLAKEFTSRHKQLAVLVNNAGASYGKRRESVDGIEMTFALNHVGCFLLTNLLLDTLKASAPSRIINVSSDVHREVSLDFDDLQASGRFNGYEAYKKSKLANVLFTYELARRLDGTGVTANAVAPGLAKSSLGLQDGGISALVKRVINVLMGVSSEEAAQTSIYAASAPELEGVSGKYFVKMKEVPSSAASYDEAAAVRLWQISADLTALSA